MGNVLLCTHSTLAEGFERAVMMIVRAAPSLEILCFEDGCSIETLMEQMRKKTERFRQVNETYCIVTDLFGASPFNAAMQVCAKETGFVVTGVIALEKPACDESSSSSIPVGAFSFYKRPEVKTKTPSAA